LLHGRCLPEQVVVPNDLLQYLAECFIGIDQEDVLRFTA
jgi:hypothetical protein